MFIHFGPVFIHFGNVVCCASSPVRGRGGSTLAHADVAFDVRAVAAALPERTSALRNIRGRRRRLLMVVRSLTSTFKCASGQVRTAALRPVAGTGCTAKLVPWRRMDYVGLLREHWRQRSAGYPQPSVGEEPRPMRIKLRGSWRVATQHHRERENGGSSDPSRRATQLAQSLHKKAQKRWFVCRGGELTDPSRQV